MRLAVLCAWLALVALLVLTLPLLPARVASPGHAGQALPALGYVALLAGTSGAVLALMSAPLLGWLGRHAPLLVKVPHRRYWLAPERRDASIARLRARMWPMQLYVLLVFAFVHLHVLWHAHPEWPQAPGRIWALVLPVHVVVAAVWSIGLRRAFPKPP